MAAPVIPIAILEFFVKKFGINVLITTITVVYIGIQITFFYFVLDAIYIVHGLVQELLNFLNLLQTSTSSFGGSTFSFGSIIYATGIDVAFSNTYSLLISAQIFVLLKISYKYLNEVFRDILAQITRVVAIY